MNNDFASLIICPGCCWEGNAHDLAEYGQCPKCGYENGNEPGRLLTIDELLRNDATSYHDVALARFAKRILSLRKASATSKIKEAMATLSNLACDAPPDNGMSFAKLEEDTSGNLDNVSYTGQWAYLLLKQALDYLGDD